MKIITGMLILSSFLLSFHWKIEKIEGTDDFFVKQELHIDTSNHLHFLAYSQREGLVYFYYDGEEWYREPTEMDTSYWIGLSEVKWDSSGHPHIIYFLSCGHDSSKMNYGFWNGKGWEIWTIEKRFRVPLYVSFYETSLDLDTEAYPHILYNIWISAQGLDSIKYAKWNGRYWEREDMMAKEESLWIVNRLVGGALQVDSSGGIHFLYRNSLKLYYAIKDGEILKKYLVDIPNGCRVPGADFTGYDFKVYLELDKKGYPHIGYKMFSGPFPDCKSSKSKFTYDPLYNDLIKYAYWDGKRWNIQPVDSMIALTQERWTDFVFKWDSKGYPHIIYGMGNKGDTSPIYYIHWDGDKWIKDSIYDPARSYEKMAFFFTLDRNDLPHVVISIYEDHTFSLLYARYVSEGIKDKKRLVSDISLQISPNPAKDVIDIRYSIANKGKVSLKVYDATGRCVKVLFDTYNSLPGIHYLVYNNRDDRNVSFPPGVYWLILKEGRTRIARKFILLR